MLDVRVVGAGAGPTGVVERARQLAEERTVRAQSEITVVAYDRIWCVMDADAPRPRSDLDVALRDASAEGFDVALSNPCFEYWFLLHFEARGSSFLRSADVPKAVRNHVKGYKKGADIFDKIYPCTDIAINNARNVLRSHWPAATDLTACNPSTHVHFIVEHLQQMMRR